MQTHKNRISLFMLLMVALSSLTLFTGIGNPYQDGSARGKQDEVTAVQPRMSDKQRAHSKLYKEYKPDVNLRALAESSHEDVEVVNGIPQKAFNSSSPPFNLQDFLRDLASKSDAVVIGAVNKKTSFLTADENFVFSDYELDVEEILKDNSAQPINVKSITVTRPGGAVVLGRRMVRATDQSLEPLVPGNRYLLFLEFIPDTGAYKAFNSKGSFLLDGDKVVKLTHEDLPYEMETGAGALSLIAHIRSAVQ
jgi:hypothetical protein